MKKGWLLFAGLLTAALLLGGESGGVSRLSDVAGISVTKGERSDYRFGLELAKPVKDGGFTVNSETIEVEAAGIAKALVRAGLGQEYPVTLTHCSLVVIDAELLGELPALAAMLLREWRGQSDCYLAVAEGCSSMEILKSDETENLRAGLLGGQIARARRQGLVETEPLLPLCGKLAAGEQVSLPVVEKSESGYRIVGSVAVGGAK